MEFTYPDFSDFTENSVQLVQKSLKECAPILVPILLVQRERGKRVINKNIRVFYSLFQFRRPYRSGRKLIPADV